MKVTYRDKQWDDLRGGMTARDLVKKLGLQPEAILVVRNGELVTEDTIVKDEDTIKLVAVISGG